MIIQGVYAGVSAPDFEVSTLAGEPFKLSHLRGKVVLLDFWASWCAPCIAELPTISQAHQKHASDGLAVVSINFDRTPETARTFLNQRSLPWTHIWAEKAERGPLAELYGVSAIPTTFLIGPDGRVVAKDLHGDELLRAVRREMIKKGGSPSP